MTDRKYGFKRQLPDFRDFRMTAPSPAEVTALPPSADISALVPEVYDQGHYSSCTAHSIAAAMRIVMKKEQKKDIKPSRMFIYWNERYSEGDISQDSGADLRTGMKVVSQYGAASEVEWEYNPAHLYNRPDPLMYKEAVQNMVHVYFGIDQNLNDLKKCLAEGYPFVYGFTVYDSFEGNDVARTGKVPMPVATEQCSGGHAVCAVGYDDATQTIKTLNSWGPNWGDKGYFYLPYAYITNPLMACDFWTIRSMETQDDANRKWVEPK